MSGVRGTGVTCMGPAVMYGRRSCTYAGLLLNLSFFSKVYNDGVFKLSMNCAEQALKSNIKRYIEMSTAQVYSCDKVRKCLYFIGTEIYARILQ